MGWLTLTNKTGWLCFDSSYNSYISLLYSYAIHLSQPYKSVCSWWNARCWFAVKSTHIEQRFFRWIFVNSCSQCIKIKVVGRIQTVCRFKSSKIISDMHVKPIRLINLFLLSFPAICHTMQHSKSQIWTHCYSVYYSFFCSLFASNETLHIPLTWVVACILHWNYGFYTETFCLKPQSMELFSMSLFTVQMHAKLDVSSFEHTYRSCDIVGGLRISINGSS